MQNVEKLEREVKEIKNYDPHNFGIKCLPIYSDVSSFSKIFLFGSVMCYNFFQVCFIQFL